MEGVREGGADAAVGAACDENRGHSGIEEYYNYNMISFVDRSEWLWWLNITVVGLGVGDFLIGKEVRIR